MGEAYLRSIGFVPFQVQFIGDPLARPFTHIPEVSFVGLGATASGVVEVVASGVTAKPGASVSRFVLLANGVTVGEADASGRFTLDTALLPDGVNEWRVVGYDSTLLESRGGDTALVTIDNHGRLPTAAPARTTGDLATRFDFTLDATGASEVRLVRAGAVLAALPGGGGVASVFGQQLGAGPVRVWAEAVYDDGRTARSAPIDLDIGTGGVAADVAPTAYDHTRVVAPGQTVLVSLPASAMHAGGGVAYRIVDAPAGEAELLWHDGKGFALVRMDAAAATGDTLTFEVATAAGTDTGVVTLAAPTIACPADLDGDGSLTLFDFLEFQNLFAAADPRADFDGDGLFTIFDFLAYQNAFAAGC